MLLIVRHVTTGVMTGNAVWMTQNQNRRLRRQSSSQPVKPRRLAGAHVLKRVAMIHCCGCLLWVCLVVAGLAACARQGKQPPEGEM